ncbi:MAG: response regulator, partial [Deltaproteobacteria bacterium]|nr:response regulator [Deltaproteobacteria bacterium]
MPTAKVLVVDDEEIVCLSCQRILTEEGYEVHTRLSGKEAMKLLSEEPFDLAIVDLKMPEMDGLELLQAIKRDYSHIPVIMITGYSTVESAVEAMKSGAFDYVPKPFTPYQWFGQISLAECHRRLNLLRSRVKNRRLHLKPHRPETSYLEGIFSRGDRRLSSLVILAWQKGCRFD